MESTLRVSASGHSRDARFPSTHWTTVLRVAEGNPRLAEEALESLCAAYWSPLYAFLRRKEPGLSPQDAEDIVQGFLARLVQRRDLEGVAPEKGHLRTYLMVGILNYRIKEATRDKAAKRDRRRQVVLLDIDQAEQLCGPDLREGVSPERAFDRQCIRVAISRAMEALREEYRARGKEGWFDAVAPLMSHPDEGDYSRVSMLVGQRRGTLAVAVHRLRSRLYTLLRAEIQRLLGPGQDPDAEVRSLLESLAGD